MSKTAASSMRNSQSSVETTEDDEFALSKSLGVLVRKTQRSFFRVMERRLKEHDISLSMWFFLRLLWEREGLSQKQCSDELGLTQPTTVAAIDKMEKRGLIRRVRNKKDRRLTNIYLTRSGRALRKKIVHYAGEVNDIATADLTSREIKTLRSLLTRINDALEADEDNQ